MAEQPSGDNGSSKEPRFSREQYDMLMRCSKKQDISEWNEWRELHEDAEILLDGADLPKAHLECANLRNAHLEGARLLEAHVKEGILRGAHLEGAILWDADLRGADLEGTGLERAELSAADLKGALLWGARLESADLCDAHLEGADLRGVRLQGATFDDAHLERAVFRNAHLESASLRGAHLESADFWNAHLEGADFTEAVVDGATLISVCTVDEDTDFTTVGLDAARVEPGLKQLLQYNVRRRRWQEWYGKGPWWHLPLKALKWSCVHSFFWVSKYGCSTGRILGVFFALAAVFAAIYWRWPSCICLTDGSNLRGFLHAFYFSVVTMTTLGFGDIHANPDSWAGQLLLMLQVLLGYILLAALVTRFAVLFTAGGPAGRFRRE